jgi:L-lysine 2,3-aminomutase
MKQRELDSMSIDEIFRFHERITVTLEAKITAERKALIDRLKQADMRVHEVSLRGPERLARRI